MQTKTPRRAMQRLILQNTAAADSCTPKNRYSILESSRSYGKLSVLSRIKLQEQIRSLSQPKLITIKEDMLIPLSTLSTRRESQLSPTIRQPQELIQSERLSYQQKLVQRKLTHKSLEYQKLLILQRGLDIEISQENYKNKLLEDKIKKLRTLIDQIVKEIEQKTNAITKAKSDVKICYVHLGRVLNPDDPEKQYREKIGQQQEKIKQIQQSKQLFAEESASYDQEIVEKTHQLQDLKVRIQLTKQKLENTKNSRVALLQKNVQIKFKNRVNRLQYQKIQLSVASIKEQEEQVSKWIGYMEYFLQVGQKLKELPQLHTACSKQIQNEIIDFILYDCSKVNYEFPRLRSAIRQSKAKREKLQYKMEVQNKKIALLHAKIARCYKYLQQEANPEH